MSCKIAATRRFENEVKKLAKKYSSLATDLRPLREELRENPKCDSSLDKGCHKIRLAIKSKGGGARVITHVLEELPELTNLVLLSIYDKGDINSLSNQQISELVAQIEVS